MNITDCKGKLFEEGLLVYAEKRNPDNQTTVVIGIVSKVTPNKAQIIVIGEDCCSYYSVSVRLAKKMTIATTVVPDESNDDIFKRITARKIRLSPSDMEDQVQPFFKGLLSDES